MSKEGLFNNDPDLAIREELLSFHSSNPFSPQTSSARSYMFSSHMTQALAIHGGEEKIVQSGLEKQFGQNTFYRKVEKDGFRVVKIIPRYRGVSDSSVGKVVHMTIIGQYIDTGEYDCIELPYHHTVHTQFGFQYKWNNDLLNRLTPGTVIPKDSILADSPNVGENNGYKIGVNANLCLVTEPETAEDGMLISESLSKKLVYDVYETVHVEFGSNTFPLNIYGDSENYKSFPDIGEQINKDSVLMVLRDCDNRLAHALTSKKDVREYDPLFDKAIYVKGPGDLVDTSNGMVYTSEVVDIKAWTCPKYKRDVLTGTSDIVDKYVKGLKQYYRDITDVYDEINTEHWKRYKNNDVLMSDRLHRLIVEAMAIGNQDTGKITYSYRNEQLDLYRLTFTIVHRCKFTVGSKASDSYGSKGVIVKIVPDDQMPYTVDEFGNKHVADIVMDPISVISRMNVGRLYEQYFTSMSRRCQAMMRHAVGGKTEGLTLSDKEVDKCFDILMGMLKIIDTEQYIEYSKVSKDTIIKREIVHECLSKEVYILYRVSSKKKPYQIVMESKDTPYYPIITPVFRKTPEGKIIQYKEKIRIAPVYEIGLNKTADNFLAISTCAVNHYGILINNGGSSKRNNPWNNTGVRGCGETEGRLFTSYGGRWFVVELKDRSGSIETHKHIYKNILTAPSPTNIKSVVDRNIQPYGDDSSLQLLNNIFNAFGINIKYTDKEK